MPESLRFASPSIAAAASSTSIDEAVALQAAMLTGLRRGELLGLRWPDVDLDAGTLRVRGTRQRAEGGGVVVAEPKSAISRRSVALGPDAVDVLRSWKARQTAERLAMGTRWQGGDDGFVFTGELGGPLGTTVLARAWDRLLVAAGLSHRPFHALRHAATTLAMAAGVQPKVAARRLGHSSPSITLDRYSHSLDDLELRAACDVEAVLRAAAVPDVADETGGA